MATTRRLKPLPDPDKEPETPDTETDSESVAVLAEAESPTVELPSQVDAKDNVVVPPGPQPEDPRISEVIPTVVAPRKPRRWRRRLTMLVLLTAVAAGAVLAVRSWPAFRDRYITPVETTAADLTSLTNQVNEDEARIDALATDLEALMAETEANQATSEVLIGRIDDLDDDLKAQTQRLGQTETLLESLGEAQTASELELQARVSELHATELMSRARLFMFQANYGLAEQDLAAARETLNRLDGSDEEGSRLQLVVDRLDKAIENVSEFPVVATNDLDIAWQLLLAPVETTDGTPAEE